MIITLKHNLFYSYSGLRIILVIRKFNIGGNESVKKYFNGCH